MRKLVLCLAMAVLLGLPGLMACEMDFIPWIPVDPPLPPPVSEDPQVPPPAIPPAEPPPPPPPPPPTWADCPPVLFEVQGGREEPAPCPSVIRWCEETLVLG